MSISFIIAIMRQRSYLQNLANSTHSNMQTEYKMKTPQKWKWMWQMEEKGFQKETNVVQTHFFVVLDFIFRDDAVGLVGLLPRELDAALLDLLLDDLADLGWSCLDKGMSVSQVGGGQTLYARTSIQPATNQPQRLLLWHSVPLCATWSKFQLQCKQRCPRQWKKTVQHVYHRWQFSSNNSNIFQWNTLSLMAQLLRQEEGGMHLKPVLCAPIISGSLHDSF